MFFGIKRFSILQTAITYVCQVYTLQLIVVVSSNDFVVTFFKASVAFRYTYL